MTDKSPLGLFLQARRAQLKPEDVGLDLYGERRRVPGLRRDELAGLAGVSESYYIRLEQGLSLNASPEVLDAIARALGLDETERLHLHDLAHAGRRHPRKGARGQRPEQLAEATGALITAFGQTPVVVLGRRSDVLGWNRTGHALFAGHLDLRDPQSPQARPNTARLVFRDPHTRELYGEDWPKKARDAVGRLRVAVGRNPEDPLLAALIGELVMHSREFTELWSEHPVRAWDLATYRMHHPAVGSLEVTQQAMAVPGVKGQRLVAVTPCDEAARNALALLAHTAAHGAGASAGSTDTTHKPVNTAPR
ncbi:MAG TPA: helix-turn-helix transcriptional regulator [Actinocrinis sp.]|nr:helix-turn-helix transcriptional regulator [Actinocrinis sp.]